MTTGAMTERAAFLRSAAHKIQHVRGIADERWAKEGGYPAVFFDITACDEEASTQLQEQLDDVLSGMSSPSFASGSTAWANDDFAPIAVLGCPSAEVDAASSYPFGFQAEAFLLHSEKTGTVHLLEIAPVESATFEGLPKVASSLGELRSKLVE